MMRPPSLLNRERRITMEGKMFIISKSELKTKSKLQLQFLFNQAQSQIPMLQNPNLELAKAMMAMIKAELQNREP